MSFYEWIYRQILLMKFIVHFTIKWSKSKINDKNFGVHFT